MPHLVLSRQAGESIVIGENTTITIAKVTGDKVKLSIVAPASVKILRGEIVAKEAKQSD